MKRIKLLTILLLLSSFIKTVYAEEAINNHEFVAATKLLYQKEFVRAIARFNKLLEENPRSAGVHHNLACAYALNKEDDKAIAEFNEAAKAEVSDFKEVSLFNLALVHFRQVRYKECSDILEAVLKDIPGMARQDNFFNLLMMSKSMYDNQFPSERFMFVSSYDEASPELPDSAYINANIMPMNKRRAYFFDSSEILPLFFYRSKCASVFLGSAYWKQEDYEKAVRQFKMVANDKEEYSPLDKLPLSSAYYYLGWFALKKDDFSRAAEYLGKASALLPDYFVYSRDLAWAYFLGHNYPEAEKACENALRFQPEDARTKEILMDVRKELQR